MPLLMLKEVPRYECLQEAAVQVPGSNPEICEVYLNLLHTGDLISRAEGAFLAEHGLNQPRFIILMLLDDAEEGSLRSSELAEHANVSRATMTGLLDTMERAELVVRAPDPYDRRAFRVKITAKGEALLNRIRPLFFQWSADALAALTPSERQQLIALLRKVQRAFTQGGFAPTDRKSPMKLKVTLAVLAVLGVAGIFAGIKYMQIQAGMAMFANYSPPPEAVTSLKVQEESWKPYLKGVGSTEAVQGVMVSTDLPGIVKTIAFESGQKVKKGDLLVQLDTTQEEAQLRASEARMHLAELNIRRIKNLLDKRLSSQSDYDQAAAEYLQQQANSEEVKATIGRKTMSLYGKDVQKTRIN